ncbi:MAG: right-handed parallel beta-helix repeat-containing protein [Armatimonadetes bacterium]|nr:right-handed parallel beta-helix repeat-containing protein [Armatimonadota bacterium]
MLRPVFCMILLATLAATGATIPVPREFSPQYGLPGTPVTLQGSGLQGWQAFLGETALPATESRDDRIRFSLPAGARTGILSLRAAGQPTVSVGELTVLAPMQGTLQVPSGIRIAAYRVGSPYGEGKPGADGSFQISVAEGEVTLVTAASGDPDVPFFTFVTDPGAPLLLNARTTAAALTLSHPLLLAPDKTRFQHHWTRALADPKVGDLARLIDERYGTDRRPLETDAGKAARIAALQSVYRTLEAEATAQPLNAFSPRPLSHQPDPYLHPVFMPSLDLKTEEWAGGHGYRLYVRNNQAVNLSSRVDTYVQVVEIDPDRTFFERGRLARELSDLKQLPRKRTVGQMIVPAHSTVKKLDIIGTLISEGFKKLGKQELAYFPIPVEETPYASLSNKGVYVVRAYNGSYGWSWGFYTPQQIDRVARTFSFMTLLPDADDYSRRAFIHNLFIAIMDALKFALGNHLKNNDWKTGEKVLKIAIEVVKATSYAGGSSGDPVGQYAGFILKIQESVVKEALKQVFSDLLKPDVSARALLRATWLNWYGKQMNLEMTDTLSLLSRVAAIGSVLERVIGMSGAEPLQTALVVTGQPFAPVITGSRPLRLRPGVAATLTGKFILHTPPLPAKLTLIPTGETTGIPITGFTVNTEGTQLVFTPQNDLKSGTLRLETAEGQTEVMTVVDRSPEIVAVEPLEAIPGQAVHIKGRFFSPDWLRNKVKINGSDTTLVSSAPDSLTVTLPENIPIGPGPLDLLVEGYSTVRYPREFRVLENKPGAGPVLNPGGSLRVNALEDGVSFGGGSRTLTLREAVMLATAPDASLRAQLSKRPRDANGNSLDPTPEPYEEELVSGDVGIGFADTITANRDKPAGTAQWNGDMTVGPGDLLEVGLASVKITGGSLILGSKSRVDVEVALERPPGVGILIPENVTGAIVSRFVNVFAPGGEGVLFQKGANHNRIWYVRVSSSERDGIRFMNGAFQNGIEFSESKVNRGSGVLFDEGSTGNTLGIVYAEDNRGTAGASLAYGQGGAGVLFAPGSSRNAIIPFPGTSSPLPTLMSRYAGNNGPGVSILDSPFNRVQNGLAYANVGPDLRISGVGSAGNRVFNFLAGENENGFAVDSSGAEIVEGAAGNKLERLSVRKAKGAGLRIAAASLFPNSRANGQPPAENFLTLSQFEENAGPGLLVEPGGNQTTVYGADFMKNRGPGALLRGASETTLQECRAGKNMDDGFRMEAGAMDNRILSSIAYGNAKNGLTLTGAGTVRNTITGSDFGPRNHFVSLHYPYEKELQFATSETQAGPDPNADIIYIPPAGKPFPPLDDPAILEKIRSVMGNRGNGIALLNGASSNWIGPPAITSFPPTPVPRYEAFKREMNSVGSNGENGILLDGPATTDNRITSAEIGVRASYNFHTPNGQSGILIRNGAHHNHVGESESLLYAIIENHAGSAIRITGEGTDHNQVEGNAIGYHYLTGYRPNGEGIVVEDNARWTVIGGDGEYGYNYIAGNAGAGIRLDSPYSIVRHNYIGMDATTFGTQYDEYTGRGHQGNGIGVLLGLNAHLCRIGGSAVEDRNYIAGNREANLRIVDGDSNRIEGNWIGLKKNGSIHLPPGPLGIHLAGSAMGNLIGGPPESGNVISGHDDDGIRLEGAGVIQNRIRNNIIGLDPTGARIRPNLRGIHLLGARDNLIGDTNGTASNLIAGNFEEGILLENDWSGTRIGLNRIGKPDLGNKTGVRFKGGAGAAYVGGEINATKGLHRYGNVFEGNKQVAIALETPPSGPFTLLSNAISPETPAAITAPDAPPPPLLELDRPGRVKVTLNAAAWPQGALVELFHNGEAYQMLDQQAPIQTHILSNLASTNGPGPGSLTATATHPLTGQTSSLSAPLMLPVLNPVQTTTVTFALEGSPADKTVPSESMNVSALPLSVRATGDAATLESLSVSLPDGASIDAVNTVRLQRGGEVLGAFDGFARAGGRGEFAALDHYLPADASTSLQVIYDLGPSAADTWTAAQIRDAGEVAAVTRDPMKPPQVAGVPLVGPRINITGGLLRGDVNADGQVNVFDAILVLRISVQVEESTPERLIRGDVNLDDRLDIRDAVGILRIIVGI